MHKKPVNIIIVILKKTLPQLQWEIKICRSHQSKAKFVIYCFEIVHYYSYINNDAFPIKEKQSLYNDDVNM